MIYNSPDINQMTCTDGYFILRNNGTYDVILKYDTSDGQKVTMKESQIVLGPKLKFMTVLFRELLILFLKKILIKAIIYLP